MLTKAHDLAIYERQPWVSDVRLDALSLTSGKGTHTHSAVRGGVRVNGARVAAWVM